MEQGAAAEVERIEREEAVLLDTLLKARHDAGLTQAQVSKGPALYWSDRVGRNTSPAVATHLLSNPDAYLTPIGNFLRKSSLDELPQLWSILGRV